MHITIDARSLSLVQFCGAVDGRLCGCPFAKSVLNLFNLVEYVLFLL